MEKKEKHLKIFEEKLVEIEKDYNKIINDKENKYDKLEELKKIFDQCNIFEKYNIEYLKLLNSVEKEDTFIQNLKKYKGSLTSKLINVNFKKYENIINKIDALDKINLLILSIVELNSLSLPEQEEKLKKILYEIKSQKIYKLNFQLLPSDNLELYLFKLYQVICSSLYEKINELKVDNLKKYEINEEKLYDMKMTKEISLMIAQYEELKNNIGQKNDKNAESNDEKELKKLSLKISQKINELELFQIIHSNNFQKYIQGFNIFYKYLSVNLNKKFFKNENLNEIDIKLFEKFIHTISNYDFIFLDKDYILIWKESLEQISIEDIKNKLNQYNDKDISFILINNNKDLQMKNIDKTFLIKNIQQYSLDQLIKYLINKNVQIYINNFDWNFELIKFLKIQYFSEYIHKNILNDKWKKFYYDVFDSKTIKSLINSFNPNSKNITKEVFIDIINSINFFNFYCTNIGQSYPLYSIFISGIIENEVVKPLEIVRYYTRIYIIILHEILGHILLFLIGSLYDKNVHSEKKINIYIVTLQREEEKNQENFYMSNYLVSF